MSNVFVFRCCPFIRPSYICLPKPLCFVRSLYFLYPHTLMSQAAEFRSTESIDLPKVELVKFTRKFHQLCLNFTGVKSSKMSKRGVDFSPLSHLTRCGFETKIKPSTCSIDYNWTLFANLSLRPNFIMEWFKSAKFGVDCRPRSTVRRSSLETK